MALNNIFSIKFSGQKGVANFI